LVEISRVKPHLGTLQGIGVSKPLRSIQTGFAQIVD